MSPIAFFRKELAPSRSRIIEAARNATKTTITTGIAATMQIVGPFGPLFAFRIGQPGISLGIREGVITIAFAAAIQAAIVPITGKFLDYPGLIMAFLFVIFAAIIYLSSNTKLFMLIALTAVGTITTVYVGIFKPGSIGWGSTYTFDGIMTATLVMVAIDTVIWPSSPETSLLDSICADFERSRERLRLVGERYLDPFAAPLPEPRLTSTLASNLALLASIKEHSKPAAAHLANLLDSIVSSELVRLEVERLALLADAAVSDQLRQSHRPNLARVLVLADEAISRSAENLIQVFADTEESFEASESLAAMLRNESRLAIESLPATTDLRSAETTNLLGFISGLEAIADLAETRDHPMTSTAEEPEAQPHAATSAPLFQPAAFKLSIKIGTAMTLALLVGLTSQRADLQTILWSVVVAGLPNMYGGVVRKTILRLAGCLAGGLAALGAMIIVSQNFDSLAAYMVAIFAVTMVSTYVAQSSEWLGYAGIQAGITFLVCYVGLGPSSNIYAPLWRFCGIVLGVLTTGFVFLFLFPEYAADKLIDALDRLIRTTLALGRDTFQREITAARTTVVDRALSENLLEVLNMADQARLEGQRGAANSVAAIESAATLIRIAYRFQVISRGRTGATEAFASGRAMGHQQAFETACCDTLEALLARLRQSDLCDHLVQPLPPTPFDLTSMISENNPIDIAQSSAEKQILMATQLESYHRLSILLVSLDNSLSRIVAS